MELRSGQRFVSRVCGTSVVVVRGPAEDVDLRCGGEPMAPAGETVERKGSPGPGLDGGTLIGKRYWDKALGLELVCTSAGTGSLSIADRVLPERPAQPLPSSD